MGIDRLIREANQEAELLMEFARSARDEVAQIAGRVRDLNDRIRAAGGYDPNARYLSVLRDLPTGRQTIEVLLRRLGAMDDAAAVQTSRKGGFF